MPIPRDEYRIFDLDGAVDEAFEEELVSDLAVQPAEALLQCYLLNRK